MDKKDIQAAIDLLMDVHEDPAKLREMRVIVNETSDSECQGSVAAVVRYLMHLRDK